MNPFIEQPLGKQSYGVAEPSSFIANLTVPYGIDRATYITYCYQTGTAAVLGVDNQIELNVLVDRSIIHNLKFPSKSSELGSTVLCVTDPIYRTSKIVGVFTDLDTEQEIFEENQWRVFKQNGSTFVDIDAKGNSGELNVTVNSGGYDNVESSFRFLNSSNKAKLNILVQGDMNIDIDNILNVYTQKGFNIEIEDVDNNKDKITKLKYTPGEGFEYLDEFENEFTTDEEGFYFKNKNGEEFNLNGKGFELKNSKANLKDIITGAFDALLQSIIQTPSGPGAFDAGTIAKFNQLKTNATNLFS